MISATNWHNDPQAKSRGSMVTSSISTKAPWGVTKYFKIF